MSASEPFAAAFMAWARSELASHYASPCPDTVMDQLVDDTNERLDKLVAMPAANCSELVLKIFPFFLANFEPRAGDDPMLPRIDPQFDNQETLFHVILEDFRRLSPELSIIMGAPHRDRGPYPPLNHGNEP